MVLIWQFHPWKIETLKYLMLLTLVPSSFGSFLLLSDMINTIPFTGDVPSAMTFCNSVIASKLILLASQNCSVLAFDIEAAGKEALIDTIKDKHSYPITQIVCNNLFNCVISIDENGFIEYWSANIINNSSDEFSLGSASQNLHVEFQFKSETDLYEMVKAKTSAESFVFHDEKQIFAAFGKKDRMLRIWKYSTGKLLRKIDESLSTLSEMQQSKTLNCSLDEFEFGRRIAIETDTSSGAPPVSCVKFDESGNFILYSTPLGIKIVALHSNTLVRLLGEKESLRFTVFDLYQGIPNRKALSVEMAASENPALMSVNEVDPTIFAAAHKKNRIYIFSSREFEEDKDRDIINEKPTREDLLLASAAEAAAAALKQQSLPKEAVIRTSLGDIKISLFPDSAPKTVENFVGLASKDYYNGVIFHRVIKGFMIQTGDPTGTGRGGESMWGYEFEDEFGGPKHDRPYTVSMANAGKNTNGIYIYCFEYAICLIRFPIFHNNCPYSLARQQTHSLWTSNCWVRCGFPN